MPRPTRRSAHRFPCRAAILPPFGSLLSLLIMANLLACQSPGGNSPSHAETVPLPPERTAAIASGTAEGWYSLYFTDPGASTTGSFRGGPDEALAAAIRQARLSVDVAAYQLNLFSVRDALQDVYRRGLAVRLVTDSDNLDEAEVQDLIGSGIHVLGDRREGLMHNKFVVIDRLEVWTGSMNLTVNGVYRNNNNLIRIRSASLAQEYTLEFEEMFVDDRFGPGSPANTHHAHLSADGDHLEVYFAPEDGAAARLLELIYTAQESILILAYAFTSDELAEAILRRAQAGVMVSGVMERSQYQSNAGSEYDRFRLEGLDVRLDGNPRNMHHKALVIDGRIVATGSYNFSANSEKQNDENLLVIDSPEIAAQYLSEFERLYGESKP